jgi:NADH-quinone oxidoreductase subunit H
MIDAIIAWFTPEVIANLIAVGKALVLLFGCVICAALLSFVERRMLALWQDRYGPNRTGPYGLLQLPADMVKMFFKEDWTPPFADKLTSGWRLPSP